MFRENQYSWRPLLYEGLGSFVQMLDFSQATFVGSLVGEIMWFASPYRRKIAQKALVYHLNISKALAARLAKHNFRHTGRSFVEVFLTRKVDYRFASSSITYENATLLQQMMHEQRPIVATTGHLGAWELLTPILAMHFKAKQRQIIVKHAKDKALASVVSHFRGLGGNEILSKDDTAPSVLRCMQDNGVSAFLVDHNAKRNQSLFLPFLGQTASVNIGPAVLAIRSKALIWPVFLIRQGRRRYALYSLDPLDTTSLKGKMRDKVHAAALFYTQAVQRMVERYPEQWFWMHKRWKTRPLHEKKLTSI